MRNRKTGLISLWNTVIWDINYYSGYVRQAWYDKYCYKVEKILNIKIHHYISKREAGKKKISCNDVNEFISSCILDKRPTLVARFGDNEMRVIRSFIHAQYHPKRDNRMKQIHSLSIGGGLFPETIEMGDCFTQKMLEACSQVDLLGVWNLWGESFIIKKYVNKCKICQFGFLEPYVRYLRDEAGYMWTAALKEKRVLVIHPFAETIQRQYRSNRKVIWTPFFEADEILPEFDLYTIKAVQTIAGNRDSRFNDWNEALQWMLDECKKVEFDVAIIGCGSYGFPLAAEIKKMGKVAIHLGGATQVLFGIRGRRWDSWESLYPLYEEGWVRPSSEETPENMDKVENGTYW